MLWRPKARSHSSADELREARRVWREIHEDARWNPWVEDERAVEREQAMRVMAEWTRAEPGHRMMTKAQVEKLVDGWREEWQREWDAECAVRVARKPAFDEARATARLQLLEREAGLHIASERHRRLVSRELFPAMDDVRRGASVADAAERIERARSSVAELQALVGDPETVIDKEGWLPQERRELALTSFKYRRERKVRELREQLATLPATLKETQGREPRAKVREELRSAERALAFWLTIAPVPAEQMCSECEVPLDWHLRDGYVITEPMGPCPFWPGWRARMAKAREMLLSMLEAKKKQLAPPAAPKPEPLAVIKSRTPIEQVIAELTRLQQEHPGAEVRRGAANRWEIWPAGPA